VFGVSLALFFTVILAASRQSRLAPLVVETSRPLVVARALAAIALVAGFWLLIWWLWQPQDPASLDELRDKLW